jgi:anti-sigma regulatory factor (Ser/Thr protein kinase)
MKIHLPNSAFLGNIDPFLRSFDPSEPEVLTISANKKWISVHPVVLSMVAALGMRVQPDAIHCEKLEARSKHYLERMGLFQFLKMSSGISITEHEPAGRFVPLTQITNSHQLTHFITEMTPLLHLSAQHAEPIRYIMSELIRNVLEHSLSPLGAIVSAQYFSKSNTIRIGIADTGRGVWQSINQSYNPTTDLDAIRLALTPGVTGTTSREGGTEYNAGAGLFFIKSLASVNRDYFMLYSGAGMYKLLKRRSERIALHAHPFKDRHAKKNDFPQWQGTVVGIDMVLDAKNEFQVLLDQISESYTQAIRDRKKAKYKKPRFT